LAAFLLVRRKQACACEHVFFARSAQSYSIASYSGHDATPIPPPAIQPFVMEPSNLCSTCLAILVYSPARRHGRGERPLSDVQQVCICLHIHAQIPAAGGGEGLWSSQAHYIACVAITSLCGWMCGGAVVTRYAWKRSPAACCTNGDKPSQTDWMWSNASIATTGLSNKLIVFHNTPNS
jgi:hypothetical protein